MPSFDESVVVTIRPIKKGDGGTKSAFPSTTGINDIRIAENVINNQGSWDNLLGRVNAGLTSLGPGIVPTSMYVYSFFPSGSNVQATSRILSSAVDGAGKVVVSDMTAGTTLEGGYPRLFDTTFTTVKNRVLMTHGQFQPQVYDGTTVSSVGPFQGVLIGPSSPVGITFAYDPAFIFTELAGTTATNGSPTVTITGTVNNAWTGKTIYIDGSELTGTRYTILSVTAAHTVTLTTNYLGATGGGKDIQVNFGNMSWDTGGPQYAGTLYDTNTGHCADLTDITTGFLNIPDTEKHDINVILTITGQGDPRFTKVILWSKPVFSSSGGVFYSLPIPNPVDNSGAPVTYNDTRSDDSQLGVTFPFQGPFQTNNAPPGFAYMTYWNGVMWGAGPLYAIDTVAFNKDMSLIQYSRPDDPSLIGRGEESWPALNILRIPAEDGRCTGLKVVGNTLVIMTDRYLYYVDGLSQGAYRLVKLSSRGTGVGQFQMAEYIGDALNNTSSMMYVAQDRMVWAQAPGGNPEWISAPVQDILDDALGNLINYQYDVRTRLVSKNGNTFLLITLP